MSGPPQARTPTGKDRLEHGAFRAALALLSSLPRPQALRFGKVIGELFFRFDRGNRTTALFNLGLAFPEKAEAERLAILRRSCHNLGRVAAEICHLSGLTADNVSRYVEIDDPAAWHAAMADGASRGGLVLTGHFGNWEMLAYASGLLGHPVTMVHRPMRNPLVEEAIRELRSGSGTRAFAKRAAARAVVQALRHHEIVVIPIDQNQSASLGVFVDFFGRPACTTSGLARLTRLTGAPVYPAFLVRQGDSERHRIVVLPRVDWVATGDDDGDIVANTQRYTKVFEDMLRRHPEQWIWFHKRWRTRPPGEAAFY